MIGVLLLLLQCWALPLFGGAAATSPSHAAAAHVARGRLLMPGAVLLPKHLGPAQRMAMLSAQQVAEGSCFEFQTKYSSYLVDSFCTAQHLMA